MPFKTLTTGRARDYGNAKSFGIKRKQARREEPSWRGSRPHTRRLNRLLDSGIIAFGINYAFMATTKLPVNFVNQPASSPFFSEEERVLFLCPSKQGENEGERLVDVPIHFEKARGPILKMPLAFCAVVLALGAAWLAGCAPASYRQSNAANKSVRAAALQVQIESQALDDTAAALNALAENPATDLRPQYAIFNRALNRLVAAAGRTDARGADMARENKLYFATWNAQLPTIYYDAIRDRSSTRLGEVTNRFDKVCERYADTQQVLRPVIIYLEDLRTALLADLTPSGLAALKPSIGNAAENIEKVKIALGQEVTELANVRVSPTALTANAANTRQ